MVDYNLFGDGHASCSVTSEYPLASCPSVVQVLEKHDNSAWPLPAGAVVQTERGAFAHMWSARTYQRTFKFV